jgi:hypothetical protein
MYKELNSHYKPDVELEASVERLGEKERFGQDSLRGFRQLEIQPHAGSPAVYVGHEPRFRSSRIFTFRTEFWRIKDTNS